jgi:hypothetical protein
MPNYTVGDTTFKVEVRGDFSTVPIPYTIALGGVNVLGVFYLTDPVENSYTDGAFVGVVVGSYHLDKHNLEACADNGLIRVCVRIDFPHRKLYGRACHREITGHWKCDNWGEILKW